ncbi:hypothetical protein K450DRAFT_256568 [Umbelopsis ramanniana AG]|uniref:Uncharacterized protein n=1 Tax=Umbelopsis ramanniana AG TaxID=1314678 RepID=A0AAD5E3L3_UMBRA|nr:uncharacterized protein K450DRAFT_256568 [Umbelopsis ramanniana AG]KAI8576518.1 hypothetical protein K450DRAFT_256568 [Umbelopsis ramanniana AG]
MDSQQEQSVCLTWPVTHGELKRLKCHTHTLCVIKKFHFIGWLLRAKLRMVSS